MHGITGKYHQQIISVVRQNLVKKDGSIFFSLKQGDGPAIRFFDAPQQFHVPQDGELLLQFGLTPLQSGRGLDHIDLFFSPDQG